MDADTEVLIKYCEGAWEEMRHIEEQRATMTNMIILISSAIIGYAAQQQLTLALIPVSALMIFLGMYGIVFTSKLHERHQFAQSSVAQWTNQIDKLHPKSRLNKLGKIADDGHYIRFPRMSKLKLNRLWITLHATIIVFGLVLTVLILVINL
jgi:uncharacterized lipoprotein YajG